MNTKKLELKSPYLQYHIDLSNEVSIESINKISDECRVFSIQINHDSDWILFEDVLQKIPNQKHIHVLIKTHMYFDVDLSHIKQNLLIKNISSMNSGVNLFLFKTDIPESIIVNNHKIIDRFKLEDIPFDLISHVKSKEILYHMKKINSTLKISEEQLNLTRQNIDNLRKFVAKL